MNEQHASQLLDDLLRGGDEAMVVQNTQALLNEFYSGFAIENLRPLLLSPISRVAEAGAFIASELGAAARPLIDDAVALSVHSSKDVRFDILDVLLSCAGCDDGNAIIAMIRLLNDDETAVRWKAMRSMSRASADILASALTFLQEKSLFPDHAMGLEWLLSGAGRQPEGAIEAVRSGDALTRRYGAISAARMAWISDAPLRVAVSSKEPEISNFATCELELINLNSVHANRRLPPVPPERKI